MSALDRLVDELRHAVPAAVPEAERLETILRALQLSPDPGAIDEYDRMTAIAGQRRPLLERLQQLLDLTERGPQ